MNEEKILEAMDNLFVACGATPVFKTIPPAIKASISELLNKTLIKHLQAFQAEVQQLIAEELNKL